jgi:hypothetical protein
MLRRRLAAAALAAVMAALFAIPGVASGTQAGEQTVSDYFKVKRGKFKVEVREAGSNQVLAKANNLKLPSGSISSLVAVGGIGEKVELLDIRDAAAAVSAAGWVATGAGGTSPSSSPGGWRFALLLLVGGGLAAATGFAVQQRRSSG